MNIEGFKKLQSPINKLDSFEIVRDQIAAILFLELENQKAIAGRAQIDPARFDMKVYKERSNPWDLFDEGENKPIINVWFSNSDFDYTNSSTVDKQKTTAIFNIDCIATAVSQETADGQTLGDEMASLEVQRVAKVIRNILMSDTNTYLQLRGLVWSRRVLSLNIFQPSAENGMMQNLCAARLVLQATFSEFSPQYEPQELEILSVTVHNCDGQILFNKEIAKNGN